METGGVNLLLKMKKQNYPVIINPHCISLFFSILYNFHNICYNVFKYNLTFILINFR